jgi:hypothetical protein
MAPEPNQGAVVGAKARTYGVAEDAGEKRKSVVEPAIA